MAFAPLACAAGIALAFVAARWYLLRRIAHIATGEMRRALFPPASQLPIGGNIMPEHCQDGVRIDQQMHQLKDGTRFLCRHLSPAGRAPTHVIVFLHGYTSNGDVNLEAMCELARRGAVVLVPDLPCHGRSDGALAFVNDLWAWVGLIWEMVQLIVPLGRALSTKPLKVFLVGLSLGGGVSTCLSVLHPTYFDGAVLVAPLLGLSEHTKPPMYMRRVLKLLSTLMPSLPLTPSKPLATVEYRDPGQGVQSATANPLGFQGLKGRLGTARELGLVFCDWMEVNMSSMSLPFIVVHGKEDKVTDPNQSQRLYDYACAKDKSIKLYDGCYHNEVLNCMPGFAQRVGLEFQPEQLAQTRQVIDDAHAWMIARA